MASHLCLKALLALSSNGNARGECHEVVEVIVIEAIDISRLNGVENQEEVSEATVPVVDFFIVASLIGLLNFGNHLVHRDDVSEERLEPGGKDVTYGRELRSLEHAKGVELESGSNAVAGARCEVVADPSGRVEDVFLLSHVGSDGLVIPRH